MASKRLYGQLCLDDIIAAAKAKHSAFVKGEKTKKIYVNVTVWLNEETDEFGHDASIQLSSKKEARESGKEKKATYIGNLRYPQDTRNEEKQDIGDKESIVKDDVLDDLPF
jgi:hypothetical protein